MSRTRLVFSSVVVLATNASACSSSTDFAPAPAPDAGVEAGASVDASTPDDPDKDTPYSLAVTADAPLLYYRLNEPSGATARDRTSNKLDGTYSATNVERAQPSLVGDENTSIRVTPGGGIDGPKDAKLAFVDKAPFSIECWISFPAPPNEIHTIVSRASESKGSGYSVWLDPKDGVKAYFGRYEGGAGATASTPIGTPLVAGTTYHLVAVYDGAQLAIHLDGVSGTPAPATGPIADGGYALRIGRSDDTTAKLSARLDELAIYGKALGKDRIEAHRDLGR